MRQVALQLGADPSQVEPPAPPRLRGTTEIARALTELRSATVIDPDEASRIARALTEVAVAGGGDADLRRALADLTAEARRVTPRGIGSE